ncbi:MAG: type II toxin-antitoxin system Phd/YefM family antitoxin [Patescibacteria group bacterium]
MDTFTISATEAKQNFSDLLNRVRYEKKTALIEKHGKIVAELSPPVKSKPKKDLNKVWEKYAGTIPELSLDFKKFRFFSGRRFKKINL